MSTIASVGAVPTSSLASVNTNAAQLQALAALRQTSAALSGAVATVATGSLASGLGTSVNLSV